MAIQVTVPYNKTFSSPKSLEDTFAYLANFEQSVPDNFPGLEKFEKDGSGRYNWQFHKIGHAGYEFTVKFLTECAAKAPKLVEIKSIKTPGYADFNGKWELASGFDGAQVNFTASFGLELPVPGFMKAVAAPLAEKEFLKFFDRYIHRVEANLAK